MAARDAGVVSVRAPTGARRRRGGPQGASVERRTFGRLGRGGGKSRAGARPGARADRARSDTDRGAQRGSSSRLRRRKGVTSVAGPRRCGSRRGSFARRSTSPSPNCSTMEQSTTRRPGVPLAGFVPIPANMAGSSRFSFRRVLADCGSLRSHSRRAFAAPTRDDCCKNRRATCRTVSEHLGSATSSANVARRA